MTNYDFERLSRLSRELHCIADMDGYIKQVNPAFSRVLGWQESVLVNQPLINYVHPHDVDATVKELDRLAVSFAARSFENRYRCKDGSYRHLRWKAYPDTRASLLYAVAQDVTDTIDLEEKLNRLECTDPLTGLCNRQEFGIRLLSNIQLMHRVGRPLSLLLVNIDYFRQLNDMHGYREGDQALKIIARQIGGAIRKTDHAARYSGDVFAIILPNTSPAAAIQIGEKCRTAVKSYTWKKHTITVSIGVSTLEDTDDEKDSPTGPQNGKRFKDKYPFNFSRVLLAEASNALQASKDKGRNRITHHYHIAP